MMGFVRNMLKWGVARWSGDSLIKPNGTSVLVPKVLKFADFAPSVIASLVSGATYGQAGNLVTVTAAGHGIPATRNGYRIFWPESAAIPAGWYNNLNVVDANTFTFQNATSQTVAPGTAITGALPYLSPVACGSITIPAGTLSSNGSIKINVLRGGDTASTKLMRVHLNGVVAADQSTSTTSYGAASFTIARMGSLGTAGMRLPDGSTFGSGNYTVSNASANFDSADVVLQVRFNLVAAAGWGSVDGLFLEVFP